MQIRRRMILHRWFPTDEFSTAFNNITSDFGKLAFGGITSYFEPLPTNSGLGGGILPYLPDVAVTFRNDTGLFVIVDYLAINLGSTA